MSARTIRRGGKGVRRAAAAQGKAQKVRTAKAKTGSLVDMLMGWLPFTEAQLHRIFLAIIMGLVGVVLWIAASFAGVPAMARDQIAALSHNSGFELHNINVRGAKNLNELQVYQIALADRNRAMPFVDVQGLRERLLQLSWVEDARVSRQLPDTMVIDIVERKPVAVLAKADRLVLIDKDGVELEVVSADRMQGKLLLSGPGAGRQIAALNELLDAAPAMRPHVKSAEWVGNRRWNLTFKTDQVLALPEGKEKSIKALMTFAQLDGRNRLLGGKAMAFDMRAPDRIYLRVPGRTDPVEQGGVGAFGAAAVAGATVATAATVAAATEVPEVSEKPAVKPADKAAAKPTEKPVAKSVAKPVAKPAAKPAEKAVAKTTAAKPADKTTAKLAAKPVAKPSAKPTAKPTAKSTAKPTAKSDTKSGARN